MKPIVLLHLVREIIQLSVGHLIPVVTGDSNDLFREPFITVEGCDFGFFVSYVFSVSLVQMASKVLPPSVAMH